MNFRWNVKWKMLTAGPKIWTLLKKAMAQYSGIRIDFRNFYIWRIFLILKIAYTFVSLSMELYAQNVFGKNLTLIEKFA